MSTPRKAPPDAPRSTAGGDSSPVPDGESALPPEAPESIPAAADETGVPAVKRPAESIPAAADEAGVPAAKRPAARKASAPAVAGKMGVPAVKRPAESIPAAADEAGVPAAKRPAAPAPAAADEAGVPAVTRPAARKASAGAAASKGGRRGAETPIPPPPGPGLVVGPVPVLARVSGGVALGAAGLLLVAPAFPLARTGGQDLGGAGNLFGFVPALPLVAVVAAAGVLALPGRLPRLALAALLSAGTLGAGLLLRTLALLDTGARSTLDLPLGIGTSARYQAAAGLVIPAVGYGLLAAAALLAAVAWPRTLMEDEGDLDPRRPRLAGWGLAVGVLVALVLGMAPYASSIAPGIPTLPERSGLDLLGALVLALGGMAWAVISATLRPRLAVVGAYAGLAAVLLSEGLADWLLVARSPAVGASAGGVGTLVAALAVAVLAGVSLGRRGPRRPVPAGA